MLACVSPRDQTKERRRAVCVRLPTMVRAVMLNVVMPTVAHGSDAAAHPPPHGTRLGVPRGSMLSPQRIEIAYRVRARRRSQRLPSARNDAASTLGLVEGFSLMSNAHDNVGPPSGPRGSVVYSLSETASEDTTPPVVRDNHVLDLIMCNISACPDVRGFWQLEMLLLRGNALRSIDALGECRALRMLDVSYNLIELLPAATFWAKLPSLQVFQADHNNLHDWGNVLTIQSASKLEVLTVHTTPIAKYHNYRLVLANAVPSLRAIDSYVVTDEELIEGADFGPEYRSCGPRMAIPERLFSFENCENEKQWLRHLEALLRAVRHLSVTNSPTIQLQRALRRWMSRLQLGPATHAAIRIQAQMRRVLLHMSAWNDLRDLLDDADELELLESDELPQFDPTPRIGGDGSDRRMSRPRLLPRTAATQKAHAACTIQRLFRSRSPQLSALAHLLVDDRFPTGLLLAPEHRQIVVQATAKALHAIASTTTATGGSTLLLASSGSLPGAAPATVSGAASASAPSAPNTVWEGSRQAAETCVAPSGVQVAIKSKNSSSSDHPTTHVALSHNGDHGGGHVADDGVGVDGVGGNGDGDGNGQLRAELAMIGEDITDAVDCFFPRTSQSFGTGEYVIRSVPHHQRQPVPARSLLRRRGCAARADHREASRREQIQSSRPRQHRRKDASEWLLFTPPSSWVFARVARALRVNVPDAPILLYRDAWRASAARTIQAAVRSYGCRIRLSPSLEDRVLILRAVICIQRCWRMEPYRHRMRLVTALHRASTSITSASLYVEADVFFILTNHAQTQRVRHDVPLPSLWDQFGFSEHGNVVLRSHDEHEMLETSTAASDGANAIVDGVDQRALTPGRAQALARAQRRFGIPRWIEGVPPEANENDKSGGGKYCRDASLGDLLVSGTQMSLVCELLPASMSVMPIMPASAANDTKSSALVPVMHSHTLQASARPSPRSLPPPPPPAMPLTPRHGLGHSGARALTLPSPSVSASPSNCIRLMLVHFGSVAEARRRVLLLIVHTWDRRTNTAASIFTLDMLNNCRDRLRRTKDAFATSAAVERDGFIGANGKRDGTHASRSELQLPSDWMKHVRRFSPSERLQFEIMCQLHSDEVVPIPESGSFSARRAEDLYITSGPGRGALGGASSHAPQPRRPTSANARSRGHGTGGRGDAALEHGRLYHPHRTYHEYQSADAVDEESIDIHPESVRAPVTHRGGNGPDGSWQADARHRARVVNLEQLVRSKVRHSQVKAEMATKMQNATYTAPRAPQTRLTPLQQAELPEFVRQKQMLDDDRRDRDDCERRDRETRVQQVRDETAERKAQLAQDRTQARERQMDSQLNEKMQIEGAMQHIEKHADHRVEKVRSKVARQKEQREQRERQRAQASAFAQQSSMMSRHAAEVSHSKIRQRKEESVREEVGSLFDLYIFLGWERCVIYGGTHIVN